LKRKLPRLMQFNPIPVRPWLKRLLKYLLALASLLAFLLAVGFLLFHFNKDQIKEALLRYVQEHQQGEIHIEAVQFSPLSALPHIAVRLDEVLYYERTSGDRSETERPILEVEQAYLGFNLLPLLRGSYDIREISLRNGEVNLIFYPDNSVNLLNALGIGQVRSEPMNIRESTGPDVDLLLDKLRLKNLKASVVHQRLHMKTEVDVKNLSAGLRYRKGVDDVQLDAGLEFRFLEYNEKTYLREKAIQLDLDFTVDEQTMVSHIRKSRLIFEGLAFDMNGTYAFRESGLANLTLDASDEDMTLLSYLIEDDILDRNLDILHEGNAYLRGTVSGKTINHIPDITFRFGAENINLDIPGQREAIEQLGFSGYFSTGEADNFSETVLRIDELHGCLPGGQISGGLEIVNFSDPLLTASCRLNANIDGWDRVFKLGPIQQLAGRIALHADVKNRKLFRPEKLLDRVETFRLEIAEAGFQWPDLPQRFDSIDARIEHRGNRLALEQLSMRYGTSVLAASGTVGNVLSWLFRPSSGVFADLELQARRLKPAELPGLEVLARSLPGGRISSLQFDLALNTAANLSSSIAPLQIKNLIAYYRGGRILGDLEIFQLKDPVCSADVQLENFPVQGWEKLFHPVVMDSLAGMASLSFGLDKWKTSEGFQLEKVTNYRLQLKDIDFHLPVFPHRFREVNGILSGKGNEILTNALWGHYAGGQLSLSGKLDNFFSRLAGRDTLWQGRLQLKADRIRFADWPYFDTSSLRIAQERVRGLYLDLAVEGRGHWLRQFPWAQKKLITVRELRGDFDVIPDIDLLQGVVTLMPKGKKGVGIDINEIRAILPFGKIKLQGGRVSVEKGLVEADTRLALGGFRPAPLVQMTTGKPGRPFAYAPFDAGFLLRGNYHVPARAIRGLMLTEGKVQYVHQDTVKMDMDGIDLSIEEAVFSGRREVRPWLSKLSAALTVDAFHTNRMENMSIRMEGAGRSDYYAFQGSLYQFSEVLEEGAIEVDLSGEVPVIHLAYALENMPVESIIGKFHRKKLLSGPVDIALDLSTQGNKAQDWLYNSEGSLSIRGETLLLHGIDLDAQLPGLRQKKPFGPVVLGAYFLAGPFGAAVTGGRDVLEVFNFEPHVGRKTRLTRFVSDWTFHDGRVETRDAGLVTSEDRFALNACIDLRSDSIEQFAVSLLDSRGCSLLEQSISGSLARPAVGGVQTLDRFPAGSVNLIDQLLVSPCEGAYWGLLKHPDKKK